MLGLGSSDAVDRHGSVEGRILGRLWVLLPLLDTSLALTWDYEKAECQSRHGGFWHSQGGRCKVHLSLAFFVIVERHP